MTLDFNNKKQQREEFQHISVLLDESIQGLNIQPEGTYIDGTAGGGGHSYEIAKHLTTGRLLAIDKDKAAIAAASQRLAKFPNAKVVEGDFRDIPLILARENIDTVDGILLDLGVSSHQLDTPERGFSYHENAPLDMRMSGKGISAYDVVNNYSVGELTRVFRDYGEERFAFRIAQGIEHQRKVKPVKTTEELVKIIKENIPAATRRTGGHPARRVFQAIRIEVNAELDSLQHVLDSAFDCLSIGGRFAIITFHSLEDRIVKHSYVELSTGCTCPPDFPICVCGKLPRAKIINRRPITASPEELEYNTRSRSAKLRVLEKIRNHATEGGE